MKKTRVWWLLLGSSECHACLLQTVTFWLILGCTGCKRAGVLEKGTYLMKMFVVCRDTKKVMAGVWLVSGQLRRSQRKVTDDVLDRKV